MPAVIREHPSMPKKNQGRKLIVVVVVIMQIEGNIFWNDYSFSCIAK
jgi:hypothetical protein